MMKKVFIYIDGNNFYFSVKNTFNCKVDIGKFCKKLAGEDNLIEIKYYIAPVEQLSNPKMYAEQQSFFDKLREIKNLKIVFGRLERRKRDGKIYFVEKATDVNLALDLVLDAQANLSEKAYLISNDGDFSGAVDAVIKRFGKEVVYTAIGNKKSISHHLRKIASQTFYITNDFIENCAL